MGPSPFVTYVSHSEKKTLEIARKLSRTLKPGMVVAVAGPIGSGKTVFMKGLSRGLGVKDSKEVKSPTFVLLHLYEGKFPIQHFDLYRLEDRASLDDLGFDEFLSNAEAVTVVEWADKALGRIPKDAVWVTFKVTGPTSRSIVIARPGPKQGRSNPRLPRLLRHPQKQLTDSSQ